MAKKYSVLVIDDDPTLRRMIDFRLSKRDGLRVFTAADGEKGIKLAKKKVPDMVLLDWKMPGMSGIQVLNALRKDPKTKSVPVLMLTAKHMMGDVETAFTHGADGYISKPFNLEDLGTKIRNTLRHEA